LAQTPSELYDQLNEAVAVADWSGAVTAIDRLITDDPSRAAGLAEYREQLAAKAKASRTQSDEIPTLTGLNQSQPTQFEFEAEERDAPTEFDANRAADSEPPSLPPALDNSTGTATETETEDSEPPSLPPALDDSTGTATETATEDSEPASSEDNREIRDRVIRIGRGAGGHFSPEVREANFWYDLLTH
jgi:hypothetical protein